MTPGDFGGECRDGEAHVKQQLDRATAADQRHLARTAADYDAVLLDASRFVANCNEFASAWSNLYAKTAVDRLEKLATPEALKVLAHRRDEFARALASSNRSAASTSIFLATVAATDSWEVLGSVLERLRRRGSDPERIRFALVSGALSYPAFRSQHALLLDEHQTLEEIIESSAFLVSNERAEARRITAFLYRALLHEGNVSHAQEVAAQMLALDPTPAAYEALGNAALSIGQRDQLDWLRRDATGRLPSPEGAARIERLDAFAPK